MQQAITTKYLGPTNTRGGRIQAIARKADRRNGYPAQQITKPYEYKGNEQEHCEAARLLAEKLGWSGLWIGGGNVDENGYVFVCLGAALSDELPTLHVTRPLIEGRDWFYVEAKEA